MFLRAYCQFMYDLTFSSLRDQIETSLLTYSSNNTTQHNTTVPLFTCLTLQQLKHTFPLYKYHTFLTPKSTHIHKHYYTLISTLIFLLRRLSKNNNKKEGYSVAWIGIVVILDRLFLDLQLKVRLLFFITITMITTYTHLVRNSIRSHSL